MSRSKLRVATVFVIGVSAATLSMPTATALPECTNINVSTTQCQRPGGSAQLNTAPNPVTAQNYQWPWWGIGGVIIGGGGMGRR